eukprot:gene48676-8017_t
MYAMEQRARNRWEQLNNATRAWFGGDTHGARRAAADPAGATSDVCAASAELRRRIDDGRAPGLTVAEVVAAAPPRAAGAAPLQGAATVAGILAEQREREDAHRGIRDAQQKQQQQRIQDAVRARQHKREDSLSR